MYKILILKINYSKKCFEYSYKKKMRPSKPYKIHTHRTSYSNYKEKNMSINNQLILQ